MYGHDHPHYQSMQHGGYSNPKLDGVQQNKLDYLNNGKELNQVHFHLGSDVPTYHYQNDASPKKDASLASSAQKPGFAKSVDSNNKYKTLQPKGFMAKSNFQLANDKANDPYQFVSQSRQAANSIQLKKQFKDVGGQSAAELRKLVTGTHFTLGTADPSYISHS